MMPTNEPGHGLADAREPLSRRELDTAWAEQLATTGDNLSAAELLGLTEEVFGSSAIIATSFGVEDIVLLHLAREHAPSLSAFMIDTGRLPPETFDVAEAVRRRLGIEIRIYTPERSAVEELVSVQGLFSFRGSTEARHACCAVRKLEPLGRALRDRRAWVTGMRREQSVTRTAVTRIEWDSANHLVKINPLAGWGRNDVWAHVREHNLPYNRLHDLGYPSIGCAPCTRAVRPYEDERAGRWWWESSDSRECGLHRR